jgi:hypothetical protein
VLITLTTTQIVAVTTADEVLATQRCPTGVLKPV